MQRFDGKICPKVKRERTEEEDVEKENVENKSYTMEEAFEKQFVQSIRYGMTYNQFWVDDPQLYYIYEQAHKEELEDRLKEKDILNWQLGQYIQSAICVSFDEKHRCHYPDKPIFFAREKKKPKTVYDMLEQFKGMVAEVNKNFN